MRQELKRFPVYHERFPVYDETFGELWVFASTVANKHHFQPVKVTLEHSKDGDHEARVRFHIFICADIKERERFHEDPESENDFFQPVQVVGLLPNVSPTMTRGKNWGAIYQAVATGAYYVAGLKTTLIMKRSTLEPIQDFAYS